MVEEILSNNQRIAYVIKPSEHTRERTIFLGKDTDTLQVGIHNREQKEIIAPHTNIYDSVSAGFHQEFIYVITGKVRVKLFNNNKEFFKSITLKNNEGIVFVSGGHSFEFLKKSQIIEVKQGPFTGRSSEPIEEK